ncbi:MAG: epoxide hydrolase N-terminal domain-containing protein, partial [Candidatus Eremiobacteraeota bacterium]|nr:epoxide hydrolase N-terminal domain-containing protein [Candidatus Eremiobacteraeota bacterium]
MTTMTQPPTSGASSVVPFPKLHVPDAELDDLRRRTKATRWPSRELVSDQSQGVQLAMIQALASYWGGEYNWRTLETKLNALPQFSTQIDGQEIHFIHVRSK